MNPALEVPGVPPTPATLRAPLPTYTSTPAHDFLTDVETVVIGAGASKATGTTAGHD